jgi:putative thioredoxin
MSLSGGIDLSKFKSQNLPDEKSVTKVANLVVSVTEKSLPAIVEVSKTVSVLLEFHEGQPEPTVESSVRGRAGKVFLGQVNLTAEPRVAAAFGATGAYALFAVIMGKPIPIAQTKLDASQLEAVMDQLISAAVSQGATGQLAEAEAEEQLPTLPKPLQEALELVDSGEVDQAHELLTKLKLENPKDVATSALLAQVTLMKRTMNLPHEQILENQPSNFDEAVTLADVLAAIGDFHAAFDLLLSLFVQVEPNQKEIVKSRLLEYFEIAGGSNEQVKAARSKLANLLY